MLDLIVSQFDEMGDIVRQSDTNHSLGRHFNTEAQSLIFSYVRHLDVAFRGMSFEQMNDLATEFLIYVSEEGTQSNGNTSIYKNALHIDQTLESEMSRLHSGIREKPAVTDRLVQHCKELRKSSMTANSKSLLQAESVVAACSHEDSKVLESTYGYSDVPESFLTRREPIWEDEEHDPVGSVQTIPSAALNMAMAHARLGKLKDAVRFVNEHMRVSQQSHDSVQLLFSLSALCQIMAMAIPGSLDLHGPVIPGTTRAQRHYLELEALFYRLFDQGQQGNAPELCVFSKLLLAEGALLHPKRTKDSVDIDVTNKGSGVESIGKSSIDFKRYTSPCQAATCSLDAAIYAKELACEVSLVSCETDRALSMFTIPKTAGSERLHPSIQSKCKYLRQSCQTAAQIRNTGWLVWGSTRLSLAGALGILQSTDKTDEAELSSMGLIIYTIYEQYGFDAIDRLGSNAKFITLIEQHDTLRRVWDIIQLKRAIHARQCRVAVLIASRITVSPKEAMVEQIENKVEVQELTSLAYLAGGYHNDADKHAISAYTLARNACMSHYALRLLLLRGRIHIESGSWQTAVPLICSVLEQYREMQADLIGAEAAMYMAKIWTSMGSGEYMTKALRELHASLPILDAHGSLEVRGIARNILAETYIQAGKSASEILPLLHDAEVKFKKLRDWKNRAHVVHIASIMHDKMNNTVQRDACAKACLAMRKARNTPPEYTRDTILDM